MNDDLERQLQTMRLAAPSAHLDRRMHVIFAEAGRARQPRPRLWRFGLLSGITIATATALVLLAPRFPEPERAVVYRLEATGRMRQLLTETPASQRPLPRFTVSLGAPASPPPPPQRPPSS